MAQFWASIALWLLLMGLMVWFVTRPEVESGVEEEARDSEETVVPLFMI